MPLVREVLSRVAVSSGLSWEYVEVIEEALAVRAARCGPGEGARDEEVTEGALWTGRAEGVCDLDIISCRRGMVALRQHGGKSRIGRLGDETKAGKEVDDTEYR
jgi:hypothetical protein